MKIELKSKDLVKNREELTKAQQEITKVQKELVDKDKEHKKLQFKVQRIKDKGVKILHKVLLKQHELDEFDYFVNYEKKGDETVECEIKNIFLDAFGDPEATKRKLREDKKKGIGFWADKLMLTGHK